MTRVEELLTMARRFRENAETCHTIGERHGEDEDPDHVLRDEWAKAAARQRDCGRLAEIIAEFLAEFEKKA